MKRILIEGMTENKGGKETFIVNIYKKLLQTNRYEFSFISYNNEIAYEDYLKETGSSIIHVPPRKDGLINHIVALNKVLNDKQYDVIWAHKTTLSACELLALSRMHRIPQRIIHSHSSSNMGSTFTFYMHSINKLLLPLWATDYLACSESAANWFFRNDNYTIIKNGIDVEKYKFNPDTRAFIRDSLRLNNSFVVGHVGQFGFVKNHKKLLNVFSELVKTNDNCKLILCGDGEERKNIEKQIELLGLNDKVLLLGIVNNIHEILQAMDIFVMPSLFEGLPFALLEAQAAGLKCIVSDTVSQESNITDQIVYLPLEMDDSQWASVIQNCGLIENRAKSFSIIKDKGYDLSSSTTEIENIIK